MIVNTTSSYCLDCGDYHPATVEKENNTILFRLGCPLREKVTEVSSDAELFLDMRKKNPPQLVRDFGHKGPIQVCNIEMTNACNFACSICFAESGQDEPKFLSTDKAVALAQNAKRSGAAIIGLTGGEPTLHPELTTVIRRIKKCGLRTLLITNGFLLKDLEYVRSLKKSGLYAAHIQFDTFDPDLHERMRGNRYIPEKIQAFENARAVGLKLSISTTVTNDNIHEVGKILEFSLTFSPQLFQVVFQAATEAGRYDLPSYEPIDREQIIHSLIDSNVIPGLTPQNCWPIPTCHPLQIGVHPDCGAFLYLAVHDGKAEALDRYVNIANVYKRLQENRGNPNRFNRLVVPLYYLLRETRSGQRMKFLKMLRGYGSSGRKEGLVTVLMGAFLGRDYQDVERLKGCGSCYVTTRGRISPCIYYRPDQEYRLLYEEDGNA